MKCFLYEHDGSGNHGCEALVRSTIGLLDKYQDEIVLVSARPEQDAYYGLDSLCRIIGKEATRPLNRKNIDFFRAYYYLKIKKDYVPIEYYTSALADILNQGDIALSIGGDTYCYGYRRIIENHRKYLYAGAKTVYWGCSIDPELLENREVREDIKKFDLVTARESISYEALKKINPNTVLTVDSAFLLNQIIQPLPKDFQKDNLIGINMSPLIESKEAVKGMAFDNYRHLIASIIHETDMAVLLIPHVVWKAADDRVVLRKLYDEFKETNRVLLIEDSGCEELKGYISRCRFFIGARTHATIAAYSTYVPTLVVGYSTKAKGIAKDLFGSWENYVLPVQEIRSADELTRRFWWMYEHENEMRRHLENIMPGYKQRIQTGLNALQKLNEK